MRWAIVGCLLASLGPGFALHPIAPQIAQAGDGSAQAGDGAELGEDQQPGDATDDREASQPTYHNEVVRGQGVWLAEALQEHFGISTVPEVAEQSLAILTTKGELLPLVENLRGRAFRKDERLRDMQVEIWVRRYDKQPLVQILRIFERKDGQRFEVDYWCDVCAIPMYETGPCACCQDHNRLRKRLVTDAEAELEEAFGAEG